MIDPVRLALLDKTAPLVARESTGQTTCAINGCPITVHDWVVMLPNRAGRACPGCAGDHGWTIK